MTVYCLQALVLNLHLPDFPEFPDFCPGLKKRARFISASKWYKIQLQNNHKSREQSTGYLFISQKYLDMRPNYDDLIIV